MLKKLLKYDIKNINKGLIIFYSLMYLLFTTFIYSFIYDVDCQSIISSANLQICLSNPRAKGERI
jgi:hypothetical protein